METVYKVVRCNDGKYFSYTTISSIQYIIGQVTKSAHIFDNGRFIETELFVFKELRDAKDFASNKDDCKILICKADKIRHIGFVTDFNYKNRIKYWECKDCYRITAPKGTYCTKYVFVEGLYEEKPSFEESFCDLLNEFLDKEREAITTLIKTRAFISKDRIKTFDYAGFDTVNFLRIVNHCLTKIGSKKNKNRKKWRYNKEILFRIIA